MRIERIDLYHVAMPLAWPLRTSFGGEASERHGLILAVHTDGAAGWGECTAGSWPGYSYETVGTAWEVLRGHFAPTLLGEDLVSIEDYRDRLTHLRGHPMARAGLEMALWDLFGRVQNRSLRSLLGGVRERVPVGVSVGIEDTFEDLIEVVEHFVEQGYPRVKLKIEPGSDVETVRAVRRRYPDLMLQVDANAAYTLDQAEVFLALDELGLVLIEQPLAGDDLIDHSQLQQQLETRLCLDESIGNARHARQALQIDACRVINIKAGRVGGLSEAVRIHDLCRERDVPVWCGGMLETGIGRAANLALASLPGFALPGDISATDRYYEQDIAAPRFELHDGTLSVPEGPGLGVEVDPEALEGFTQRREVLDVRDLER